MQHFSPFFFLNPESELVKEMNKKTQLTKLKQKNLCSLYNAVAEQRKCMALKESAKNENCLHKILAEDLVEKALFIRDKIQSQTNVTSAEIH